MRITLKQLKIFIETARERSISSAADKCFISQPAASKALSTLESQLDVILFDRCVGKELKLTNEGEAIFAKAVNVLKQVHEIEVFKLDDEDITGHIVVGASYTIADYVLSTLIAKFNKIYPNIEIEVLRGNTIEITKHLENFFCDIAFVEGSSEEKSNKIKEIFWKRDILETVCSKNHPLAKKDKINITDLFDYDWVKWKDGAGSRSIIINEFKTQPEMIKQWFLGGIEISDDEMIFVNTDYSSTTSRLSKGKGIVNWSIVLDNAEAIKNYVINSNSLAALSATMLKNTSLKDIKILNVTNGKQLRNFYSIVNTDKYLSSVTQIFLDWALEQEI